MPRVDVPAMPVAFWKHLPEAKCSLLELLSWSGGIWQRHSPLAAGGCLEGPCRTGADSHRVYTGAVCRGMPLHPASLAQGATLLRPSPFPVQQRLHFLRSQQQKFAAPLTGSHPPPKKNQCLNIASRNFSGRNRDGQDQAVIPKHSRDKQRYLPVS